MDVGTSGGVWGLERGYCMMIGGEKDVVKHLDPIFSALAPGPGDIPRTPGREKLDGTAEQGLLALRSQRRWPLRQDGPQRNRVRNHGGLRRRAGRAPRRQHRKASGPVDAETTPLRDPEHYQYELDLRNITEVWRRGSVIASWLLDLTATALLQDPTLSKFTGRVSDSGEGRWTIKAAIDEGGAHAGVNHVSVRTLQLTR